MTASTLARRTWDDLPLTLRKAVRYGLWFFRISRWGNILLLSATLYLVAAFLLEPDTAILERLLKPRLLAAVVATACVTAGGYIINDYFDVQIDRVNRPGTGIVGRRLPRRRALIFHWCISTAGVLLGMLASQKVGILEMAAASLLYLYSAVLKRTAGWGNVLVSLLTAAALLVPFLLFGHAKPLLWSYVVFSFLISVVREVIKDCEDMRGDAAFGCRTLPIVYGLPFVRPLLTNLVVVLLGCALALPWLGGTPVVSLYNLVLIPACAVFIVRLRKADTRREFRALSSHAKLIMALGVAGMCFA